MLDNLFSEIVDFEGKEIILKSETRSEEGDFKGENKVKVNRKRWYIEINRI